MKKARIIKAKIVKEKNNKKSIFTNISFATISIILGFIIYIIPSLAIKTLSLIVGLYFILQGICYVINYIKNNKVSTNIVYGIINLSLGLVVVLNPFMISNIITLSLGIWLIFKGAVKLNYALNLRSMKFDAWLLTLVVGIITIIFGIMVITNPFTNLVIAQVIGLFMIVYGVIDLTNFALIKRNVWKK